MSARHLVLALALPALSAQAAVGTNDNVPAATLLLPYFEARYLDSAEQNAPATEANTMMQVRNSDTQARLVHVTLWTDYGLPTLGFYVYLNAGDSQDIDMRLTMNGVLPTTGPGVTRLNNQMGSHTSFPGCPAVMYPQRLDPQAVTDLRNAHTGRSTGLFAGACASSAYGDDVARGYATVDVVNGCDAQGRLPDDDGYFIAGGTGVASNANVLFGEWSITHEAHNFSFADRLVSIEADAGNPITSGDAYTFYSGVAQGSADNREPLGTTYRPRYLYGGAQTHSTDIIVWRDPHQRVTALSCNLGAPAPFPLGTREIVLFDEQSDALRLDPAHRPFALATQRVPVTSDTDASNSLTTPFTFGAMHLSLNDPGGAQFDPPIRRQGWVVAAWSWEGRFQSGQAAVALDNASNPIQFSIAGPSLPVWPSPAPPPPPSTP